MKFLTVIKSYGGARPVRRTNAAESLSCLIESHYFHSNSVHSIIKGLFVFLIVELGTRVDHNI